MILKQVGFKPGSNPQASATSKDDTAKDSSSGQSASSPVTRGGTGKESTPANNIGGGPVTAAFGRRRSSASDSRYGGLDRLKRGPSNDKSAAFMDQKPGGGGVISGLWDSFTRK